MLHVGKGVKTHGSEKDQDSCQSKSPQIIQLEREHSLLRKMQYLHPLCPDDRQDSQQICKYHDQGTNCVVVLFNPQRNNAAEDTGDHRIKKSDQLYHFILPM